MLSWRVGYDSVKSRSEDVDGTLLKHLRRCGGDGDAARQEVWQASNEKAARREIHAQALRALRVHAGNLVRRHVPSGECVTRLAVGVSFGKPAPQSTLLSVLQGRGGSDGGFALAVEAARLREVLPQLQDGGDASLALALRLQQEELSRGAAAVVLKSNRGSMRVRTLDSCWGTSKKHKPN